MLRRTKGKFVGILLTVVFSESVFSQSSPQQVGAVLQEQLVAPEVAVFQMKEYLLKRVAKPPAPANARTWTAESARLRQHLLKDVVFHGWPSEWVNSPPNFRDLGEIEGGKGFRMRKLRYEIVPGFYSAAILYEPENLHSKVPAVLNVNGHVGPPGKSVEYKQKICINFAKRGIIALNLEWFHFGELGQDENNHWFGGHLDLVGANALGLFYLAVRRGIDYLAEHPHVDPMRLGVTGLSGGGWQTIVLSALDERVSVSVPVAGYSSLATKLEARRHGDLGDFEQNSTDLQDGQDYTHLTAIMAPRATLLIHNAEDDCCFRGPLVKPLIFDALQPIFRLYGKEGIFDYHENRDPSTHNYGLDNRLAAYRFFSRHFGLPAIESEIPAGQEINSYDELVVGLPNDNLTILDLARKMGKEIARQPVPSDAAARSAWATSERQKLTALVRYKPAAFTRVWTLANTKSKGLETKSYLFEMADGLSASGVWLKGIDSPTKTPPTIVLNDKGKKEARSEVSDRVNRDEQVLALDLLYTGDAWEGRETERAPYAYAQLVSSVGERPLALEAGQLIAVAHWLRDLAARSKLRLEVTGIRNQVTALVAAAIEPELFSEVVIHEGMPGLAFLLNSPVTYQDAPDLFCLDFYKEFDLDRLATLAAPTKVSLLHQVSASKKKPANDP